MCVSYFSCLRMKQLNSDYYHFFLILRSVSPCFMEHTKLSTAAWMVLCYEGGKLKSMNTEFPEFFSVAEPLVLNVCVCCSTEKMPCSIALCVSHFIPMEKQLRAACRVSLCNTYRWSSSRFFKRHKVKEDMLLLIYPILCYSFLLICIFYRVKYHCFKFNRDRI